MRSFVATQSERMELIELKNGVRQLRGDIGLNSELGLNEIRGVA
jgi:hypothetical protein